MDVKMFLSVVLLSSMLVAVVTEEGTLGEKKTQDTEGIFQR